MQQPRGYKRSEDPLTTPRWVFQTIVTASVMVMTEHEDGNVQIRSFDTFSAPEHDEKAVVKGILQVLKDTPASAEFVSWTGSFHDLPMLACAAMKYGLSLPPALGLDRIRRRQPCAAHRLCARADRRVQDEADPSGGVRGLARHPGQDNSGSVHGGEVAAGQWDLVQEVCEGDVISLALLLVRWRKLLNPRADIDVVEDRILREIEDLRAGRGYIPALQERRAASFKKRVGTVMDDAEVLAPWLQTRAARFIEFDAQAGLGKPDPAQPLDLPHADVLKDFVLAHWCQRGIPHSRFIGFSSWSLEKDDFVRSRHPDERNEPVLGACLARSRRAAIHSERRKGSRR